MWSVHTARLVACAFLAASGFAQEAKPTEFQVKAAYLYNFGRFVTWQGNNGKEKVGSTFPVCVLGQDPFGTVLDTLVSGETIGGLPVVVKRAAKVEETLGCRVLFISGSEEKQLPETLAALDSRSVLTVSDIAQFARKGGMVELLLDGSRVRFEVNLAAADRAKLSLSSELLKLAVTVRRAP